MVLVSTNVCFTSCTSFQLPSIAAKLKLPKIGISAVKNKVDTVGAGRIGLRVCPGNPFNDLQDEDPRETFAALFRALSPMGLAYLHVIRMASTGIDNIALAAAL